MGHLMRIDQSVFNSGNESVARAHLMLERHNNAFNPGYFELCNGVGKIPHVMADDKNLLQLTVEPSTCQIYQHVLVDIVVGDFLASSDDPEPRSPQAQFLLSALFSLFAVVVDRIIEVGVRPEIRAV